MKILVIGGSPKGEMSVTMQYVEYLKNANSDCEFEYIYPAQRILAIEKNRELWNEIIEKMSNADGILWAFPLYVFLVHAGLKRFIELLFERNAEKLLAGKYCASLSTSIHFFDHTAHNYIKGISEDIGMLFVESHSPKMGDLFEESGRKQLVAFFNVFLSAINRKTELNRETNSLEYTHTPFTFIPSDKKTPTQKKVLFLTDIPVDSENSERETNLEQMVQQVSSAISGNVKTVSINSIGINGNCMGCLKCGDKNICAYENKDGFTQFYREEIKKADIIYFAGAMHDRYLSAAWKRFFDRSFFNTHQPTLTGKHFGFIVSGPLSQSHVLKEVIHAYSEWQGAHCCGIISDENKNSDHLRKALNDFAETVIEKSEAGYIAPSTFLGVGGMKIFRDDIYENLKMVFREDHRNYKRNGVYDYIQSKPLKYFMLSLANIFTGIPFIKKQMFKYMKEGMVNPYKKVLKKQKAA